MKTMMNYNYQNVMDSPVPHIGVDVLQPTPFKRGVQSLRDGTKHLANKVKCMNVVISLLK